MKLKLKPCVTDEDFLQYGITDYNDDFKKIRDGKYIMFKDSDSTDTYYIMLKGKYKNYWYVKKHWFITVKE